jgi:hypothetical protein
MALAQRNKLYVQLYYNKLNQQFTFPFCKKRKLVVAAIFELANSLIRHVTTNGEVQIRIRLAGAQNFQKRYLKNDSRSARCNHYSIVLVVKPLYAIKY